MSRDAWLYIAELHDALDRVRAWTANVAPEQWARDDEKRSAVERQLLIAGEAAKAVPAELRELAPDVNWRGLARLRDFLAHAYYAVDADELWNICTAHAPADLERLRVLLALHSGDHGSD
jgi:uncharacterized protein with HEPN domain